MSISTSDEGVTATFEDGTIESGTLLIGAEGAHSVTREWLFQSSPQEAALQHVPISSFSTVTKPGRELALAIRKIHPGCCMTMCPNGFLTFVSRTSISWRLTQPRRLRPFPIRNADQLKASMPQSTTAVPPTPPTGPSCSSSRGPLNPTPTTPP